MPVRTSDQCKQVLYDWLDLHYHILSVDNWLLFIQENLQGYEWKWLREVNI
jgi:hypothetical protein